MHDHFWELRLQLKIPPTLQLTVQRSLRLWCSIEYAARQLLHHVAIITARHHWVQWLCERLVYGARKKCTCHLSLQCNQVATDSVAAQVQACQR